MPIPAVVSFRGFPERGFPERGECQLVVPDQGYPAAVASGFAAARRATPQPEGFRRAYIHLLGAARSRPASPEAPEPASAHVLFHYRVSLVTRRRTPLIVECWRRYTGGIGWQRRCGPMPLECFTQRFSASAGGAGMGSEPLGHGGLAGVGVVGGGGA